MSTEQEKKFQELQNKHQSIRDNAVRINAHIDNAQDMITKLKEAAQKKFNESDLTKLKEMAQKWELENTNNLNKYSDDIERASKEINDRNNAIKAIQQQEQ